MHILIQPVYLGSIQTGIVIATDKNLVGVREVTKPIHEINGLLFDSIHGEIPRMYKDVSIGQLCEPPMLIVGVGEVEDGHLIASSKDCSRISHISSPCSFANSSLHFDSSLLAFLYIISILMLCRDLLSICS